MHIIATDIAVTAELELRSQRKLPSRDPFLTSGGRYFTLPEQAVIPRATPDALAAGEGNIANWSKSPLGVLFSHPSVKSEMSVEDAARVHETAVLSQLHTITQGSYVWLTYTLTVPEGQPQEHLLEAHVVWRERMAQWLSLPESQLLEYRVVEYTSLGTPHLHGFLLVQAKPASTIKAQGLKALGTDNVKRCAQVGERLWRQILRSKFKKAAQVEPLRSFKGLRYATKSLKATAFQQEWLGPWHLFFPLLGPLPCLSLGAVDARPVPAVAQRDAREGRVRLRSRRRLGEQSEYARWIINTLATAGVTSSNEINAIVQQCDELGWFSPRTFNTNKKQMGYRSTVLKKKRGRIVPRGWAWRRTQIEMSCNP